MLSEDLKAEASRVVAGMDTHLPLAVEHFVRLPSDLIPDGSPLAWYRAALDYMLRDPGPSVTAATAFVPMLETTTAVYPAPVPDVPEEAKDLWEFGAELASNPGVAARLHHLCFAVGTASRGAHLREAASVYLTLGRHADVKRLERVAALRWALELSALMRDEARESAALDALVEVAEAGLAEGPREPGVSLRAISTIVEQQRDDARLPPLLDQAEAVYTEAYLASDMAALRRKIAQGDQTEVARVNRAEAERWLAEALATTGPVRMMHLEQTIELARNHGFADIAATATRELQAGGRDA